MLEISFESSHFYYMNIYCLKFSYQWMIFLKFCDKKMLLIFETRMQAFLGGCEHLKKQCTSFDFEYDFAQNSRASFETFQIFQAGHVIATTFFGTVADTFLGGKEGG